MGNHSIAASQRVLHLPPRVIRRSGLHIPYIPSIPSDLARLERIGDRLGITDGASSGIDKPCAGLHLGDQFLVEQTFCLFVQGAVDGNNVALGQHVFEGIDASDVDGFGGVFGERSVVKVQEFLELVEGQLATWFNRTIGAPCSRTASISAELGSRFCRHQRFRQLCSVAMKVSMSSNEQ